MSLLTSVKSRVNAATSSIKTLDCFGAKYELSDIVHHGGKINCAMKQSICQFAELINLESEFYNVDTKYGRRHHMSFVADDPNFYKAILNLIYVSKMGDKNPNEHFNNVFNDYKAYTTTIYAKWTSDRFGNHSGESILIEIGHHQPRYHCTLVFRPIEPRFVAQV